MLAHSTVDCSKQTIILCLGSTNFSTISIISFFNFSSPPILNPGVSYTFKLAQWQNSTLKIMGTDETLSPLPATELVLLTISSHNSSTGVSWLSHGSSVPFIYKILKKKLLFIFTANEYHVQGLFAKLAHRLFFIWIIYHLQD